MKLFKITDLFDIKSGAQLNERDWGEPIYSFVGSSGINNGITGKCDRWNYENVISIAVKGSVGYTFWHPYKFMLCDRCKALIPKFDITENIALYLCIVMTNTFTPCYSYSNGLNLQKLERECIYLPAKDNNPDWEYIDQYMESLKPTAEEWIKFLT